MIFDPLPLTTLRFSTLADAFPDRDADLFDAIVGLRLCGWTEVESFLAWKRPMAAGAAHYLFADGSDPGRILEQWE